jgi:tRNA pseudouridine55 synthase
MLGVVNLDKPVGPTSHDMVGLLRRLTGTRRIGHAGTLDPLASGVLPILIGAATRFSQELTGGRKRYDAVIRLGARSTTDDAEGPLLPGHGPVPGEAAIRDALAAFVGELEQRPPAFSARKHGGRTAHRAARAGEPIDLPPRMVMVHGIDVRSIAGNADGTVDVRIDLRCGAGTYVRSIARDLGEALGCGGYLVALRRTEAAGLSADDAVTPEHLEELGQRGALAEVVLPIAGLLPLPRLDLDDGAAARFLHGSSVQLDAPPPADGRCAVFAGERLLGVGTLLAGRLQPDKVLSEQPA